MPTKINCYDSKIWRPSNFDSRQRILFHFVLALSIDKQLFYEYEFKFKNLKFCKITNKINKQHISELRYKENITRNNHRRL